MAEAATKLCECGCGKPAPIAKANHASKGHVKGQPLRFILGHGGNHSLNVWSKIEVTPEGCWRWTGAPNDSGYGTVSIRRRSYKAHRHIYELFLGPIPEGLDLDHLCHNEDEDCPGGRGCLHRRCVHPAHLEPATRRMNVLRGKTLPALNVRKTHCPQGHPYDEANTYQTSSSGGRGCLACRAARKLGVVAP